MKVEVDMRAFSEALREFATTTRRDLMAATKYQAKLLVRDIIKMMKPESGPKGRQRVARDIARVFKKPSLHDSFGGPRNVAQLLIANQEKAANFAAGLKNRKLGERVLALSNAGDSTALERLMRASKLVRATDRESSDIVSSDRHNSAKHKHGHVPTGARGKAVVYTGKRAALAAYIKSVQERVGRAKGGWGEAAAALGVTLPAFVSKHSTGRGQVIFHESDAQVAVTVINRDPAAVGQDAQFDISDRAYTARHLAMTNNTEKILAARAAKASAHR